MTEYFRNDVLAKRPYIRLEPIFLSCRYRRSGLSRDKSRPIAGKPAPTADVTTHPLGEEPNRLSCRYPRDLLADVIVTMLPLQAVAATRPSRKPSARIAGKGRILGDIVAPAAPEDDWDALK
jgi:hypothetical protein